jgi:hypothetical protein
MFLFLSFANGRHVCLNGLSYTGEIIEHHVAPPSGKHKSGESGGCAVQSVCGFCLPKDVGPILHTQLACFYCVISSVAAFQGDQKGRIFAQWEIAYFRQFFENYRRRTNFWLLFPRFRLCINFVEKWVAIHFGRLF